MNGSSVTVSGSSFGAGEAAFVNYEVVNQYGEVMTNQNVTWTQSTGGYVADDQQNGRLTITNTQTPGTDFIPGTKIFLTGVHAQSGTVVNAEFVIGLESKPNQVEFKGVYNTVTKKVEDLPAGFTEDKYVLLFEVNDQYGNKMALSNHNDLVFTSNNPLFVGNGFGTVTDVEIDGVSYEAVEIDRGSAPAKGGEVTIQAISKITGKTAAYTIKADAESVVKTLTMSAPTDLVAEGERVEVPFSAVDQYGNAVTKYEDLVGNVTLSANIGSLAFVKQNDGTAKLYFTAAANSGATNTTDAPVYLTSLVTEGGSFSSLMVNVKDQAQPTAIIGLDSKVSTSVAKGNFVEFTGDELIVQDQYGRTMKDADFNAWLDNGANSVILTSELPASGTDASAFTVVKDSGSDAASNVIADSDDAIKVAAKTLADLKTSERLVFALSTDGTNAISSSAKSITFTKVAQSEYASYEVADLGTIYHNTEDTSNVSADHAKTVKVYGVKADGTKVLLPASDYSVALNETEVAYNNGTNKISEVADGFAAADFQDAAGNYKDVKVQVLVTVNDSNGAAAAIIEKELLVSNKAPKVATVTLDSNKVTDGKANISAGTILPATFAGYLDEVVDQYGADKAETPAITITNLTKVTGSSLAVSNNGTANTTITGATLGDKFTATYKYASGVTVSVSFTVGLDNVAPVLNSAVAVATYDFNNDGDVLDSGETGNFVVVTFSEGVTDETGAVLTASDFVFTDDSTGGVTVSAVNHTAGSATAVVSLSGAVEAAADTINVENGKVEDSAGNVADHTATAVTIVAAP